jgi:hypothetical protein
VDANEEACLAQLHADRNAMEAYFMERVNRKRAEIRANKLVFQQLSAAAHDPTSFGM